MRNSSAALCPGLLLAAIAFVPGTGDSQERRVVDFGYAPATHLTAICFSFDWEKTVVTERGSLAYDFGPGPYTRPLTEISVSTREIVLEAGVPSIRDPRIPVVTLELKGRDAGASLEEFALAGGRISPPSDSFLGGKIRRTGGLNGAQGWASPAPGVDPAFRNAAWGTNRPILYRVGVQPGSARRIALGFCEPYKGAAGQRVMDLRVEGADPVTIDALKDNEKNRPYVYFFDARDLDGDGEIAIEVHASTRGVDPNVILNAFWVFAPGTRVTEEEVIRGEGSARAEISWSCGMEFDLGGAPSRVDGILARFEGKALTPVVIVRTGRELTFDKRTGALGAPRRPFVVARPSFTAARKEGNSWILELPRGTPAAGVYVINGGDPARTAAHLPDLQEAKRGAVRFWNGGAGLPFGRIAVPDSGIQYVLDASIRDLYQIAEQVDGGFQFEPGPSVYRGLWLHDAAWDVETALALGDTAHARMSLEASLRFQMKDGRVLLSEPFPMQRETPLTLFALCRYARVSGNTPWLKSHMHAVNAAVGWIRATRARTLVDPSSPTFGLFPAGFTDGGIGGLTSEYGTTFWALNALRAASKAAASIGQGDSARSWNALADDLTDSFRKASARDARRDAHGNLYLPMRVGDTSAITLPQQANWGLTDGQAFGHLFPYDDPLLNGTLAMLDANMTEGIHQDVGWLRNGVWPFFTAQVGIVHAYQRNYAKAQDILYAVANHASPLGTWLEEQLPKELGTKTSGDASDATAASLFILLLRDLIVNDRTDTVEALGGVPSAWYRPGARLRLDGVGTDMGPVTLDLIITSDGNACSLSVGKLTRGGHGTIRVVLAGLQEAGFRRADGSELPPVLDAPARGGISLKFLRR